MQIPGRRLNNGEEVITSPFPRGGDGLFLRAQLIDASSTGAGNTKIQVWTRNSEDTTWTQVPASTDLDIPATTNGAIVELHVDVTDGIKEELRLKVIGPATSGWSLIRIFQPVFYDAGIGSL
jgi:hypothetical protein